MGKLMDQLEFTDLDLLGAFLVDNAEEFRECAESYGYDEEEAEEIRRKLVHTLGAATIAKVYQK